MIGAAAYSVLVLTFSAFAAIGSVGPVIEKSAPLSEYSC